MLLQGRIPVMETAAPPQTTMELPRFLQSGDSAGKWPQSSQGGHSKARAHLEIQGCWEDGGGGVDVYLVFPQH